MSHWTHQKFSVQNRPLSFTRCREMFLDALKAIGIHDAENYGLHSLRSGGASHLADRGVSEEAILQHGRWKTPAAKNRYVQRNTEDRLLTAKTMFL